MNSMNTYQSGTPANENTHPDCNLTLQDHLNYADALVKANIIDENTGKSIKERMTASFLRPASALAPHGAVNTPAILENSEFLRARSCLLNYLKNLDLSLSAEELKAIEAVVLELEKAAIQKEAAASGQRAFETLNKNNELAKERLMTASSRLAGSKYAPEQTFTREDIAKMSTAEFIKNEPIINYQLQNGLL